MPSRGYILGNKENWACLHAGKIITDALTRKLIAVTSNFLLQNKLVKSTFVLPDYCLGETFSRKADKQYLSIPISNIRRILPILKDDSLYSIPYIRYNSAYGFVEVILKGDHTNTFSRYFRKYKLNNSLTFALHPEASLREDYYEPTTSENRPYTKVIIRIRNSISTLGGANSFSRMNLYPTLLYMPIVIKVLTTWHRKAFFK